MSKKRPEADTHTPKQGSIPTSVWIRFILLGAIWLWFVGMVWATHPINFWTLFLIASSGIIVFVPLYKKYIRDGKR